MDQVKVGKYIYEKRKELGLTQKGLADIVGVTDKSVSKWERGDGLPDSSRLPSLCEALKVNINELLAGEDINDEALSQKAEENLMELMKENENRKSNNKIMVVTGIVFAVITLCLLGISIPGSSVQSVAAYFDPVAVLLFLAVMAICVMLTSKKANDGYLDTIRKTSIPCGGFIGLFKGILLLKEASEMSQIGPALAEILPAPMYGLAVYLLVCIIISYKKEA